VVLAFVVLATVFSFVVPLGEGPDEPGHARYVFFLARERRLPIQHAAPQQPDVAGEGHQPPLAYALMAPLAAWLPSDERQFDQPGNVRFTWSGGSELNAVAHGSREYLPWRGFVLAWHLARLVSVALGAATIVFTYLIAGGLERRSAIGDAATAIGHPAAPNRQSPIALLAAGLVAFNPQFLFISALVTNDALLVALSAALLWLIVRDMEQCGNRIVVAGAHDIWRASRSAAAIGLVLGLALITKQSAIVLVPIALLWVLQLGSRGSNEPQSGERASGARSGLALIICAALSLIAATLLVSGGWYARNWRLYGDLFGLGAFQAEFATQPFVASSLVAWWGGLVQLHASFWARFGWMNVPAPSWVTGFFLALEALGLVGWLAYASARRQIKGERSRLHLPFAAPDAGGWWPLLALPPLAFGWVVSFAIATGLVAWQGRLLFPALPALAIVLAVGIGNAKLKMPNVSSPTFDFTLYILHFALIAIAIWLLFGVIRPAYPFHTLPEPAAQDRLGTPAYGRFGLAGERGAELRGWRLDGIARPGETLELTLMWHALARQNRNWTVFIHIVDAQEQIVAEDNRQPQDGAFPMRQWVDGDWVEDRHALALPASLAPGEYHIRVGLFDPRTTRRAGMYSQRGKLRGDFLEVGSILVAAH
jgi:4-amino-4-deoxy-L-arabinose transferase-like glycosyltransferase